MSMVYHDVLFRMGSEDDCWSPAKLTISTEMGSGFPLLMITESNEEMPAHPDAIREDLLVALINGAWVMKLHEEKCMMTWGFESDNEKHWPQIILGSRELLWEVVEQFRLHRRTRRVFAQQGDNSRRILADYVKGLTL